MQLSESFYQEDFFFLISHAPLLFFYTEGYFKTTALC